MNKSIRPQQQKLALSKKKLQPFGSHFLTKLDKANYKLTCSLSAADLSDFLTDDYGRKPG